MAIILVFTDCNQWFYLKMFVCEKLSICFGLGIYESYLLNLFSKFTAHLGANAILAVSLAVLKAGAAEKVRVYINSSRFQGCY